VWAAAHHTITPQQTSSHHSRGLLPAQGPHLKCHTDHVAESGADWGGSEMLVNMQRDQHCLSCWETFKV
jgi:hypothetical protein